MINTILHFDNMYTLINFISATRLYYIKIIINLYKCAKSNILTKLVENECSDYLLSYF